MKKKISCLLLTLVCALGMTGCGSPKFLDESKIDKDIDKVSGTITIKYRFTDEDVDQNAEIRFELDYQKAPNTVANFYKLATEGFYTEDNQQTIVDSINASSTTGVTMGSKYYAYVKDEKGKVTDEINYDTKVAKDCGYKIAGEMALNEIGGKKWERNDNRILYGSIYMVLSSSEDFNSASSGFGIATAEDEKWENKKSLSKSTCVFGRIDDANGDFHDFVENSGKISLSGENCAKIVKITFDKTYDFSKVITHK